MGYEPHHCTYRFSKIQVHFRAGIGGDTKISETAQAILHELDELARQVRVRTGSLERTLEQLEQYQVQQQQLRQKIMHEEQQLRLVLAPTYLPHDRERAVNEQQVGAFFRFFFLFRIESNFSCLTEIYLLG